MSWIVTFRAFTEEGEDGAIIDTRQAETLGGAKRSMTSLLNRTTAAPPIYEWVHERIASWQGEPARFPVFCNGGGEGAIRVAISDD